MTPLLQFALTFVTLVVLTVILYSRLIRYESYMREEKEGIQRLNERLQSVADGFESITTKRLEQQLSDIHDVLERISQGLDRPTVIPAAPPRSSEGPERPGRSLIDVVESKLYNLGYGRVTVVSDLAEANPDEPFRVTVEADKDGVTHKGHLVIQGSSVTEFEMQPNYTTFP